MTETAAPSRAPAAWMWLFRAVAAYFVWQVAAEAHDAAPRMVEAAGLIAAAEPEAWLLLASHGIGVALPGALAWLVWTAAHEVGAAAREGRPHRPGETGECLVAAAVFLPMVASDVLPGPFASDNAPLLLGLWAVLIAAACLADWRLVPEGGPLGSEARRAGLFVVGCTAAVFWLVWDEAGSGAPTATEGAAVEWAGGFELSDPTAPDRFAAVRGIRLPEAYRALVVLNDRAFPVPGAVRVADPEAGGTATRRIEALVPFEDRGGDATMDAVNRPDAPWLAPGLVAFAVDDDGALFAFDYRAAPGTDDPPVVLILPDAEAGGRVLPVASGFGAFLGALVQEADAP